MKIKVDEKRVKTISSVTLTLEPKEFLFFKCLLGYSIGLDGDYMEVYRKMHDIGPIGEKINDAVLKLKPDYKLTIEKIFKEWQND